MAARRPPVRYRREGFAGQRVIVLPAAVAAAARHNPLLAGLLATDAGFFSRARGHRVDRPRGTSADILIICLAGRGWVRVGSSTAAQHVGPGNVIWLPGGTGHVYGSSDDRPWSIVWTHIVGTELPAWRRLLGPHEASGVIRPADEHAGDLGLGAVHQHLEAGYGLVNLLAAATALRGCLVELKRRALIHPGVPSNRDLIARSIERIRANLHRPFQLSELAAEAGLSVSHYSKLFRSQTSFSPISYYLRMRVQAAARLLDTGDWSVAEIAASLGYADAFYFSKQFKRFMGQSPRAYRTVRKG